MEVSRNHPITINMKSVIHKLCRKKYWILATLPAALLIFYAVIASFPRYYQTSSMLAPEVDLPKSGGGLSSIASTLGIDMSNIQSVDAITPTLYPDLLTDNHFIVRLFSTPVTTSDGKTQCDYYSYLLKYQKHPWWSKGFPKDSTVENKKVSPYRLTKQQNDILKTVQHNIQIKVNSKDGVITIMTTDQDPLVCRTVTDSVINQLKGFITKYRTSKAIKDYNYYKKLTTEAKAVYVKARQAYGSYSDANQDVVLQSVQSKIEDLENDMQLKYNAYTNYNNQLQAAAAKVQERTPVFTLIKGAEVPVKPAGPKRALFALCMTFLIFCIECAVILRKDIRNLFTF
ncbi:hypothetical protein PRBRB14_24750 [Hallella multisaccharivorax DSM 17128]|uniref:Lipopolysaccharide biosynthesis protein n=2 Tax=Hallella multisaccharivorax TaxID=310514 RepID=F8N5X8_9BACT|nr:hypothetical protein Premu_1757 [Hallella multisaccharivorax DSM 17128]GJG31596.1 hypothetical protein PRBRB14_24750 [Hallella multisaccharivorax DSM 17128]